MRVLVLAAPCNGLGDVIFALKFARYLRSGYSRDVTIVTPSPELFKKVGIESKIGLVRLGTTKRTACRRFRNFSRPRGLHGIDLFFVAPLQIDFKIEYSDVSALFRESSRENTFFLSEYQDSLKKKFDFPTGIGKGYMGLLFDDAKAAPKKSLLGLGLGHSRKFALGYIANGIGYHGCGHAFVEMLALNYPSLQVVLPAWLVEQLARSRTLKRFLVDKTSCKNVSAILENGDEIRILGANDGFVLRGDILPVPRTTMLALIKYSVKDILVTGDQSITDVLDCCETKRVWYQIAPWKTDFAKALSRALHSPNLASSKTSCGRARTLDISKENSLELKRKFDFRVLAKPKLDEIFYQ